jgi:nicotinamide mononucleotide transporter
MGNKIIWRNWSAFELGWILTFVAAGTWVTVFTQDSLFNYGILLSGIFCVVLAAKGNIYTYACGLFNSLGYGYLSYKNGFYGDMALNLLFFVPTSILGFLFWRQHLTAVAVKMRALQPMALAYVLLGCGLLIALLGLGLAQIKSQNSPYLDATSTILSIAATCLMLGRYKEQWILYIVLNLVTIVMWLLRFLHGSSDGAIMLVMWTAFLINSVYGYWLWQKGAKQALQAGAI